MREEDDKKQSINMTKPFIIEGPISRSEEKEKDKKLSTYIENNEMVD